VKKPNRLAKEASPYLLQHAQNPVDWWPWSPEALAEAKRRDVPILLSIGYSACHWCHVMERESFEDEAIAKQMNEAFVSIKVDREERPDLDQIYQLVVQLLGRSGGWPLTVFLTPEQKPFFGGTYFPPSDRYGMPGFPKILQAVAEAYREKRSEVEAQSGELARAIAEVSAGGGETHDAYTPGPDLLDRACRPLLRRFDDTHGGFGTKPKFPNTMPLEILLRRAVLEGDGGAKEAVRLQLDAMRKGGIWDHLGGGFHRYSTDERWLVPHFEKMLYDNALLLRSYVDGWRVMKEPLWKETADAIARYVTREMTDATGGFYASQDADSEGHEGKFFVWDAHELRDALGDDALTAVALDYFGVTDAGNFEEHGHDTGKTVLAENRPLAAVAAKLDRTLEDVTAALARATETLRVAREKRVKPFRDEKILTSWNALMIAALAEAGGSLRRSDVIAVAEKALDHAENVLVKEGRVLRLAKDGIVKGPGFLDDHAYLANAALDVYEVTGDPRRVTLARSIADAMIAAFHDPKEGFFFTPKDGEALITRSKDAFDHAVPSGVSMACRALLRLGALFGEKDAPYTQLAEKELLRLAPAAVANPFGYGQTLCELDRLVRGTVDVILVGKRRALEPFRDVAFQRWLPNRTVAWIDPTNPTSRAACPAQAEGKPDSETPVAYVCRNRTCSLPQATPEDLAALLDASPP
jgi:uncharacterized protein YyaL (SSP411 family)